MSPLDEAKVAHLRAGGLTYREIAERFGVSTTDVRSAVQRAMHHRTDRAALAAECKRVGEEVQKTLQAFRAGGLA